MTHPFMLPVEIMDATGRPSGTPFDLAVFPERVKGPQTTPLAHAMAILASFGQMEYGSGADAQKLQIHATNVQTSCFETIEAEGRTYVPGSWMALPADSHSPSDVRALFMPGKVCIANRRVAADRFFRPSCTPKSFEPFWPTSDDAWLDSTHYGILLGAIDAHLPLPFAATSYFDDPIRGWMVPLMMACARAIKPWIGAKYFPPRGHDSRPFPASSTKARVEQELLTHLLGWSDITQSYTRRHGPTTNLLTLGHLVPNTGYAPTAWVAGRTWSTLLASFPPEIVEAGRAAGRAAVRGFDGQTPERAGNITPPEGSTRHASIAWVAKHAAVERALLTNLNAFSNPRPVRASRKAFA